MENRVSHQKDLDSLLAGSSVFVCQIRQESLPFYLQAAGRTGFRVEKIAKAGEDFKSPLATDITVMKGFVGIAITTSKGVRDHATFYNELNSNPKYQEFLSKPHPIPRFLK